MRTQLETYPFPSLKLGNDAEEVFRGGVSFGPEHSHQALRWNSSALLQRPKPIGCVDVVAKNRLSGIDVSREHAFDGFAKKRLAKSRIALNAIANSISEVFGQWH